MDLLQSNKSLEFGYYIHNTQRLRSQFSLNYKKYNNTTHQSAS